ncbi:MAG: hypothetical protein ABI212_06710 [Burkholderiaceae bacterium]
MKPLLFPVAPLAIALAAAFAAAPASAQTPKQLAAELREVRAEMQQLRRELEAVKLREREAATAAAAASAAPVPSVGSANASGANPSMSATRTAASNASPPPAPVGAADANATQAASGQTQMSAANSADTDTAAPRANFFGYGEFSYSRPRRNAADAIATVRRGVLGWAYSFDDRTRFAAELEVENAVVSADDRGEVALEQFYLERDLTQRISARAGLFILPIGYLNEVHEPTRYYGVTRNFVETAIIPTTWRELGLGFRGTTQSGLRWDAGAVTSFDLTKWDASSTEGRDFPLASIHQEGQLAKARNIAFYGALNYNGIPGFNVGGSVFTGGVGQKQPNYAGADARVTLGELHTRWQPGKWDLSALVARGGFSDIAGLNATFAGQTTPIPSRFGGWYGQAAYRLWQSGDYALNPFVRYERFNTALGYPGLPQGLAPALEPDMRVVTLGASFYLHPQVVLKADYQTFLGNHQFDRFNVGLGFHF